MLPRLALLLFVLACAQTPLHPRSLRTPRPKRVPEVGRPACGACGPEPPFARPLLQLQAVLPAPAPTPKFVPAPVAAVCPSIEADVRPRVRPHRAVSERGPPLTTLCTRS